MARTWPKLTDALATMSRINRIRRLIGCGSIICCVVPVTEESSSPLQTFRWWTSNISAALAAVFMAKGQAVNLSAGHSILMSRQQEAARAQSEHKTKKNGSIWPAVTAGRVHWRYLHNDLLWRDPIVLRLCIFSWENRKKSTPARPIRRRRKS